jgi:hypothetical protein
MSSFTDLLSNPYNGANINIVVDMTLQRPELLDELWQFAINTNPAAWKAVWVMDKINDTRPDLIIPYLKPMLEIVEQLKQSGQKRHMLKLLSLHPLPAEPSGGFIDYCFTILQSRTEPVAGRVHAMQLLFNIAEMIPEFKNELRIVIEDVIVEGTAGIRSRGTKLLKTL